MRSITLDSKCNFVALTECQRVCLTWLVIAREPHHLPLTQLRIVSAAVGSLIVPAVYLIIRKLGHSQLTAILGSGLLVVGKIMVL